MKGLLTAAALLFAVGASVGIVPATAAGSNLVSSQKLSWTVAERVASEAVRTCAAQGYSVTAAVVDPSGHQQVMIKGDTVPLQSLSVSYRKAYTAFHQTGMQTAHIGVIVGHRSNG
jgi:uncharacterized protein GlcG (DUF336 family)